MILLFILAAISVGFSDGFGFDSHMSTNGFKFKFPGFSTWPSDSRVLGGVRERFDQMFNNFGREKPGMKTKIRKDNEGDSKVTTVTQDGKGYHSITRYSHSDDESAGKGKAAKILANKQKHHKRNMFATVNDNAFLGPEPQIIQLTEKRPVAVIPQHQCTGHTPCEESHFCNPLLNICQRVQPEGSTCQFKNQCGPPEAGIVCVWGRCARASAGSLGSLCNRDTDCVMDAYCTLHQSISPFYPMCTPKLDQGSTCGQPKFDVNPLNLIDSLFGSKCEVEKPSQDYCKSGLKCAPVGWFGYYVCVPESLKITPYSCPDNDEENTIGEGTYPEEPVTEEILEQEIEDKTPGNQEQNDNDNEGIQELSMGNLAQPAPGEDHDQGSQADIAVKIGSDDEEVKDDGENQHLSNEQDVTEEEDKEAEQAVQTVNEMAKKIEELGKVIKQKEKSEGQKQDEEETNQNEVDQTSSGKEDNDDNNKVPEQAIEVAKELGKKIKENKEKDKNDINSSEISGDSEKEQPAEENKTQKIKEEKKIKEKLKNSNKENQKIETGESGFEEESSTSESNNEKAKNTGGEDSSSMEKQNKEESTDTNDKELGRGSSDDEENSGDEGHTLPPPSEEPIKATTTTSTTTSMPTPFPVTEPSPTTSNPTETTPGLQGEDKGNQQEDDGFSGSRTTSPTDEDNESGESDDQEKLESSGTPESSNPVSASGEQESSGQSPSEAINATKNPNKINPNYVPPATNQKRPVQNQPSPQNQNNNGRPANTGPKYPAWVLPNVPPRTPYQNKPPYYAYPNWQPKRKPHHKTQSEKNKNNE